METIQLLQKAPIKKVAPPQPAASSCCGGAPTTNEDACCKLDEDKKAEGESGCGCSTTPAKANGGGCC